MFCKPYFGSIGASSVRKIIPPLYLHFLNKYKFLKSDEDLKYTVFKNATNVLFANLKIHVFKLNNF